MTYYLFAYWHDKRWTKFVGASVKIWDLALNLSKLGNQVVLFLPKYQYNTIDLPFKVIEIPIIDKRLFRLLSFNLFLILYLICYYTKNRPQIVYVRRMNSIVPALFAKITKALFFYEVNDDPYDKQIQEGSKCIFRLRSLMSRLQDEINLRLCDRAFVISQSLIEKITCHIPLLSSKKFKILPSGANTTLFVPLDKHMCRSRLKLRTEDKILGFAGTLLEHQGVDTLIQAAPSILKTNPNTTFLIIGEGPKKREWIDQIARAGLSQKFIFPGQILYEDMPIWLGATDLCLAPFLNSAGLRSPVKIFDYLACGKFVVASKIKGTTEIFEDCDAILLVEPEKPELLADTICELLNETERIEVMGATGRQFVLNCFDRKDISEKVHREVHSLLPNRICVN